MNNYQNLSENELQSVITKAEQALRNKKVEKRKDVIEQIQQLASSIGVKVDIIENEKRSSRKGIKVPVKYCNPDNPNEKWTGRGVTPKWLRILLESGRDKSEFEI